MYTGTAKIDELMSALSSGPVGRKDLADEISKHEGTADHAKYGF